MGGFEVQELRPLLSVHAVIDAHRLPILPGQFILRYGPARAVRLGQVTHGHQHALVVVHEGLDHQVPDHLRMNQHGVHVVLSGVVDDEVEQVGFRPEVAQDEDVGFRSDEPLHEEANLPLQEAVGAPLNRREPLEVVGDVQGDGQQDLQRGQDDASKRVLQVLGPVFLGDGVQRQGLIAGHGFDDGGGHAPVVARHGLAPTTFHTSGATHRPSPPIAAGTGGRPPSRSSRCAPPRRRRCTPRRASCRSAACDRRRWRRGRS